MAITLPQLLEARDARRDKQQNLLRAYPGEALVVLTVNIPGSNKRTRESVMIGKEGVKAVLSLFPEAPLYLEQRDLPTGFETFFVFPFAPADAKRIAIAIEQEHPLGRIMDIDVIDRDCVPISRTRFGAGERQCLICGENARECMREGRHTVNELNKRISDICNGYIQRT